MSGGGGGLAGGIIGAVIGFVGTGGNPMGAYYGYMIGSMVGSLAFPPKIPGVEGPRLSDLKGQYSQYGRSIPTLWGNYRMAGNITFNIDIAERSSTQGGGKGGGGPAVTSYAYYGTWMVMLTDCKGGPITGVRRIWDTITGKLLYDVSPAAALTSLAQSNSGLGAAMTVYTGTSTQLADPTMEALLGVGNVPGYRYRSYVVFNGAPLEQFSNRIPNLEFEIISGGTVSQYTREASDSAAISGLSRVTNPQFVDGIFTYDVILLSNAVRVYRRDLSGAVVDVKISTNTFVNAFGGSGVTDGSMGILLGQLGGTPELPRYVAWMVTGSGELGVLTVDNMYVMDRRYVNSGLTDFNLQGATLNATQDRMYVFYGDAAGVNRWRMYDENLNVLRDHVRSAITLGDAWIPAPVVGPQPLINGMSGSTVGTQGSFAVESDNIHLWHFRSISNQQKFIDLYRINDDGTFTLLHAYSVAGEIGPSSVALGAIAADNGIAGGMTGDGKMAVWTRSVRLADGVVSLSTIVSDLALRKNFDAELTLTAGEIDVTALTDSVAGYAFSVRTPARTGLEQLAQAFYFDATESDGKIKFVKRGAASVITIPDDDLDAHEYGSDGGDIVEIVTQQAIEVPSEITVLYPDKDNAYQIATQTSRRVSHVSGAPMGVQIPVVINATKAKNISDVLRADSLTARDAYVLKTSVKYAKYEPTDVITAQSRLLRIVSKNETPNGVITWTCSAEDSSSYTKSSTAAIWATQGQSISIAGPTSFYAFDIPLLRDQDDNGYPFYGVAQAYYPAWQGGLLYKSTDGGASYAEVAALLQSGFVGYATTALGAPLTLFAMFDETNSVTALLPLGAVLSNATEAQLLANPSLNALLIGSEVIRYKTVVSNGSGSYTFSGLLRGLRGTEWASSTHAINDVAVILDADQLVLVPGGLTDINVSRYYRAVTFGSVDGSTIAFTNTGVGQKPYSPVLVTGTHDSISAWILSWVRRTRTGGDWVDVSNPPVSETSEAYEVDILNAGVVVRTVTGLTSPTYTYSDALALTDFGSAPTSFTFRVYQMSSTIGRGYAGTAVATRTPTYASVVLTDTPIAYYHLNEASGAFVDVIAARNSTTHTPAGRSQTSLVTAGDACCRFDAAIGETIQIPSFPQLTAFTFELWFKPTYNFTNQKAFLGRDTAAWSAGNAAFYFRYSNAGDGKLWLAISTAVNSTVSVQALTTLAINTTYHIVGTYDGANLKIYINGVLIATTPTAVAIQTQTGNLIIGAEIHQDIVANTAQGYLDEVAIYSTALSAARIAAHYASG